MTKIRLPPRAARWALRAGAALLALYLSFVLVANIVLATHVIEKQVNAGTKDVEMHWGRAWTLWPGRMHVDDFVLRVDDANVQALLTIDHAVTGIDLLPLLRKRVNLHEPVAEGCRFWMRHRVTAIGDDNRVQVAAFPPIPGADPPLFDPVRLAQPAPPPDALWQIDIDGGEVYGDELWLQEFRYRGAFRGAGGFYFWPLVELTVRPITGSLLPGLFTIGEYEVSRDLAVDVQLSMARFEVPEVLGLDPVRGLDAHAVITAHAEDGKFLAMYRPLGLPSIDFERANVRAELDFHQRHFTEHTDATVTFQHVGVKQASIEIDGPLQVSAKGRGQGHVEVGADTAALDVRISSLPATRKTPWRLERASIRGDVFAEIDKPLEVTLGAARAVAIVPSLDWLTQLSGGDLHASGRLQSQLVATRDTKGQLTGSLDTTFEDTQLSAKSLAAAFGGTLKTSFVSSKDAKKTSFSNVALDLPIFTLRAGAISRTTWVRAKLTSATLSLEPTPTLQGEGDLETGDSSLFAVPIEDVGGVAAFAAKWLRGGQANLRGKLKVGGGGYAFDLDRGRVGQVEVLGFIQKVGAGPFGAFAVSTAGLSAGIRIDAGGVSVSPFAGAAWVHEQRTKAR